MDRGNVQAARTKDGFRLTVQRTVVADKGYGPEEWDYHVVSFDVGFADLGDLVLGKQVNVENMAFPLTDEEQMQETAVRG